MFKKRDEWIISGIIQALNIEDFQLDRVSLRKFQFFIIFHFFLSLAFFYHYKKGQTTKNLLFKICLFFIRKSVILLYPTTLNST